MTISSGTIVNNSAYQAGGIYNEGTLTLTGGTITSNSAVRQGGGVDNYSAR